VPIRTTRPATKRLPPGPIPALPIRMVKRLRPGVGDAEQRGEREG
jgi:hypothetical protein